MRVIAGTARGHKLIAPEGDTTRPPLDMQKEALFSMLADTVAEANVLDLFSGSGSMGIEALSRGARSAVFVDNSDAAADAAQANLAHTKFTDKSRVIRENVVTFLKREASSHTVYDLIFLDPPFRIDMIDLAAVFEVLCDGNLAGNDGLIVLRLYSRIEPPDWPGFSEIKNRAYGDSRLLFYRPKGR